MEQDEAEKASSMMESEETKNTSEQMEKTAAQKVAEVAGKMAATKRRKESPKDAIIAAIKAQEKQFKKAIKNGYTRKEILANLKEQGITITARDLAVVLGKKSKEK